MRFAYADPPYPGREAMYGCAPIDHKELITMLTADYDGWALSTGSNNLRAVLLLCPPDVRIASWVKPFASFKPNVNPAYTWEPVIFTGSRKRERMEEKVRDHVAATITMNRTEKGGKPDQFCFWIFALLNAQPSDEFVDLFPGSGAVSRAWELWKTLHGQMTFRWTQLPFSLGEAQ